MAHEHDGQAVHDHELTPLEAAHRPPDLDTQLLAHVREQWRADRELIAQHQEQAMLMNVTINFQNQIIAALKAQLGEAAMTAARTDMQTERAEEGGTEEPIAG
jgi:hypothetical protein